CWPDVGPGVHTGTAASAPAPGGWRVGVVAGLRYSEQALRRGKRARSSSRTDAPARASSSAVAEPAGPPPTTMTSQESSCTRLQWFFRTPPSAAKVAPTSVAARFTPSLSSQRQPLVSRTGSWHTLLPRSNRASHAGHSYFAWTVAPSSESLNIPATPAAAMRAADPGAALRGLTSWAKAAIAAAPATPPIVPSAVIPPDAPRPTRAPVVMRRGANGEKAPNSVAQVSAA